MDHDILEDYVHISPGVRTVGSVIISKGTWLDIFSIVSNNVNICSGCKVGAVVVVIKDILLNMGHVGDLVRKVII